MQSCLTGIAVPSHQLSAKQKGFEAGNTTSTNSVAGLFGVLRNRQGLLVKIMFDAPEQCCIVYSTYVATGKTRETGLHSTTYLFVSASYCSKCFKNMI